MNALDRVALMGLEVLEQDPKSTPMNILFTYRPWCPPETRWVAEAARHESTGLTPELALRGLDSKLAVELQKRIDRAQAKIDSARRSMAGEATPSRSEEGR